MKFSSSGPYTSETQLERSSSWSSSIRSLLSRSVTSKHRSGSINPKVRKYYSENIRPVDSNIPEAPGALVPPQKQKESSKISGSELKVDVQMKPELPIEVNWHDFAF